MPEFARAPNTYSPCRSCGYHSGFSRVNITCRHCGVPMDEAEARARIRDGYNRGLSFPNFYDVYKALENYDSVLAELCKASVEPAPTINAVRGQPYWDELERIAYKLDAWALMVARAFYEATADRNNENVIHLLKDDIGPKVAPIGSELSFIRRCVNDWLYRCQLSDTFAPPLKPAIIGQAMTNKESADDNNSGSLRSEESQQATPTET